MSRRVTFRGKVKQRELRSRSESESEQGAVESRDVDPKPGELPMGSVKRG